MALSELSLNVEKRTATGKNAVAQLRRRGLVPGIVYGHGLSNLCLAASVAEIKKVARHHGLLTLHVAGEEQPKKVLLRAIQRDFMQDHIIHVDFQEVRMDEMLTARVPVVAVGTPVGIAHGGSLEQQLHEIVVQCLPQDLPEKLICDVSALDVMDSIAIPAVKLPPNVRAVHADPHAVVFHLSPPRAEEEVATAETPEAAAAAAAAAAAGAAAETAAEPERIERVRKSAEDEVEEKGKGKEKKEKK